MTNFQDTLIQTLGGQRLYNFAIMNYCDSLRQDPKLAHLFQHLDLSGLMELQKELLQIAFCDQIPSEAFLYGLDTNGFTNLHFDAMKDHLLFALRHAWLEESLVEECDKRLDTLRPLFQQQDQTKSIQRTSPIRRDFKTLGLGAGHQRT